MRYRIRLSAEAGRELPRLPGHVRQRLRWLVFCPTDDPWPSEVVELRNQPEAYRTKPGRYRLVFEVDDTSRVVGVLGAGLKEGPRFYHDLPDHGAGAVPSK